MVLRKTMRDYKGLLRALESRKKRGGGKNYENKFSNNVKSSYQRKIKCVDFPRYTVIVHSPYNFL